MMFAMLLQILVLGKTSKLKETCLYIEYQPFSAILSKILQNNYLSTFVKIYKHYLIYFLGIKENGFSVQMGATGMLGKAIYFAENSSKSDNYTSKLMWREVVSSLQN